MAPVAILVTNNPRAAEKYADAKSIRPDFSDKWGYRDVLVHVRDMVYGGWHLLTHPQASNLKPNQCPYKTVLISDALAPQPFERDVELIESAIAAYDKFTKGMTPPAWSDKALSDFQTVDLSVIDSAVNSSLFAQLIPK